MIDSLSLGDAESQERLRQQDFADTGKEKAV